jgi:hypothetical protein
MRNPNKYIIIFLLALPTTKAKGYLLCLDSLKSIIVA